MPIIVAEQVYFFLRVEKPSTAVFIVIFLFLILLLPILLIRLIVEGHGRIEPRVLKHNSYANLR